MCNSGVAQPADREFATSVGEWMWSCSTGSSACWVGRLVRHNAVIGRQVTGRSCGMDASARIQAPRWGAHFSARVKERIIKSVYIHMVLQACQLGGQRLEMGDPPQVAPRSECTVGAPDRVEIQWTTLDDVCLQEIFKQRFAILQGCPANLKARYRHALTTALEAVHTTM